MSKIKRDVHPCNAHDFGTCVVFNCVKFDKYPDKTRHGSDNDANMIKKTFMKFDFDVVTISNPTEKDVEKEMDDLGLGKESPYNNLKDKKIFVCFILSHGNNCDEIYTKDGTIFLKENILDKLHNIATLKGKTKIIVIQACRGDTIDPGKLRGTDTTSVDVVPTYQQVKPIISEPDFFLVFSSTPGYASIRNSDGTTFIHMFCTMLEEQGSTLTLSELVQRVIFTISCIPFDIKKKSEPRKWVFQIPYFFSSLLSPVVLGHRNNDKEKIPKTYEIKDKAIDDERQTIIRKLHERANNQICSPTHPVVEERDFLLLVKQTTGSYDTTYNNNTKRRQCLIIKSDSLESHKAHLDTEVISEKMKKLHFEINVKTTTSLFTKKESNQKNGGLETSETHIIDIEAFNGEKQNSICCFLCFIQHKIDECEEKDEQISNVICKLKCQTALLNIPKVFILQPYRFVAKKENETDCLDGNTTPAPDPVKSSIESDVLIIYAASVDDDDTPTLTQTFCEMLEKNADDYSVIDLLEEVLPKEVGETWADFKPTFSSTMQKHLVIRKEETPSSSPQITSIDDTKRDSKLLTDLQNFSKKIKTGNNNPSKMSQQGNIATNNPDNIDAMLPAQLKLEDQTSWTNTHVICGYIMIVVCILLIVLHWIGIVFDVTRYHKYQNYVNNTNLAINNVKVCEHECRRLTIFAFDISGLTTNSFSTITCILLLMNIRRKRTFTCCTNKISCRYRFSTVMLFAFNVLSFSFGVGGIAKRLEYDFKDEVVLSAFIVILSLVIMVMMAAILYRFLRGRTDRIIVI